MNWFISSPNESFSESFLEPDLFRDARAARVPRHRSLQLATKVSGWMVVVVIVVVIDAVSVAATLLSDVNTSVASFHAQRPRGCRNCRECWHEATEPAAACLPLELSFSLVKQRLKRVT